MRYLKGLGKQIRAWRIENGLSQTALSNLIGLKQISVSQWERGRNEPTKEHLEQMKVLLKLSGPMLFEYCRKVTEEDVNRS